MGDRRSYIALCFAVALSGLGCSSPAVSRADAGVMPPSCTVPLICGADGAVHSCDGKTVGALVDNCPSRGQACSLGRCTSLACQNAEARTRSVVGCLFYTLQADNVTTDEPASTSYILNNAGSDPANVQLQRPAAGTNASTVWTTVATLQVPANSAGRLHATDYEVRKPGINPFNAVRVASDRPITVAEIESDDITQPANSTGGTMVLPLQSLGNAYRAVTYPQEATRDVQQLVGSRGGAARVIVIGTQNGTSVEFTPVTPISGDPEMLVDPLAAGQTLPLTLNDGDVFQIYTNAPDEDLTGAQVKVTWGAAVAVFSGNIATSYGSNNTGINSADMAHEQMPPVSSWSHTYVATPLGPQASVGCTSFFGDSNGVGAGSIWRVVADQDDTEVSFGPPTPEKVFLHHGESVTRVSSAPFTVSATHPVLLTQGMDCEPSLSLGIGADANALLTSLAFATVATFDQVVAIVRPSGAPVELDGTSIPGTMFQPVGGGYDLLELPLAACTARSGACLHKLTSTVGFGMSMRGMDVAASFALTAPGLLRCESNSELCLN